MVSKKVRKKRKKRRGRSIGFTQSPEVRKAISKKMEGNKNAKKKRKTRRR